MEDKKSFLFLDDNPDRHLAFDQMLIGKPVSVDHVWTAEECIRTLRSSAPYDCVFLDHDLGGRVFVQEEKGSGSEVAAFIGKDLDRTSYPKRVVVHSWNPAGAERMVRYIAPSGIPCEAIKFSFPA